MRALNNFFFLKKSQGRSIVENLDVIQMKRPQTAKPVTSDIENLKSMINELNYSINEKRSAIQELNQEIEKFHYEHKVLIF